MNLYEFVDQRSNTNIMKVTIPHRHDLLATWYINSKVQICNKELHKIMKNRDNVRILHHELTREDLIQQAWQDQSSEVDVSKYISAIWDQEETSYYLEIDYHPQWS
jgi:hypothetical protein